MQRPIAQTGTTCPLHKKDVSKVCHKCEWFIPVKGKHPQSEEIIDRWGCAMMWLPTLMINTAQEIRQGAVATESYRNEMVRVGRVLLESGVTHTARLINGGGR
jgi:hypothetical protein